jgi:hypothetical protein
MVSPLSSSSRSSSSAPLTHLESGHDGRYQWRDDHDGDTSGDQEGGRGVAGVDTQAQAQAQAQAETQRLREQQQQQEEKVLAERPTDGSDLW